MSRIAFGRASAGFSLAGAFLTCSGALAQPQLDLTHSWVRSFPGSSVNTQSYANGVAVLDSTNSAHRGTVVVAGHSTTDVMIMSFTPQAYRGFVAFVSPDGAPGTSWVQNFVDAPGGGTGQAVCTGAAVGSPGVLNLNGRFAFASGWFSGGVDFRSGITHTALSGLDAFLAKLDRDSTATQWVLPIRGSTGEQVALAVAVGPDVEQVAWPDPPRPVRYFTRDTFEFYWAAVGGYFTGEIVLNQTIPAVGGEDGFIGLAFANSAAGTLERGLAISGPGDARVLALAADPVDARIIAAGYYSSGTTNFNPHGTATTPGLSYVGLKDIFVAKYRVDDGTQTLTLDWLFTTGTAGDDGAAAVGVDIRGHVYATGWRIGQGGTRDIWIAKIEQPADQPCTQTKTTTCAWTGAAGGLVYAGAGDDAGLGLVVDGLDRVCFTGQFAGTVDFNPLSAVDKRPARADWTCSSPGWRTTPAGPRSRSSTTARSGSAPGTTRRGRASPLRACAPSASPTSAGSARPTRRINTRWTSIPERERRTSRATAAPTPSPTRSSPRSRRRWIHRESRPRSRSRSTTRPASRVAARERRQTTS